MSVVGGLHRSGTSMMMRALAHSSNLVPLVHQHEQDRIAETLAKKAEPGYDPNPNGYWMADPRDLPRDRDTDRWVHLQHGCLVKAHHTDLAMLHPGNFRIVYMERDPEARARSYERAFGKRISRRSEIDNDLVRSMLAQRKDVTLTVTVYEDVIEDPLREFTRLADAGWPIDPAIAASYVDPALCRNSRTAVAA